MDVLPLRRRRLRSPGLLIFLGVCVLTPALAIPALISSQRASNERKAATSLKTLVSAEGDFRATDRDQNGVAEFWTGDISGLYYVQPTGTGPQIRLIEESLANADERPLFALANSTVRKSSYLFQALERDDSVVGEKGIYRVDTDKSGRKVHNMGIFGFCAYPENDSGGKCVFAVNQDNTVFPDYRRQPWTTWPSDEALKKVVCYED